MSEELLAIDVEGTPRREALAATVLYVEGEAARALARTLAQRVLDPQHDRRLLGIASGDGRALVLTGPTDALPWIEGARYFGIDADAPRLRLSCTHAPRLKDGGPIAASLLERALLAKLASARALGPLLVMRGRVIPLGAARPLDASLLGAFASRMESRT